VVIPASAGHHGWAGDADPLGDLGVGDAVGGQEQDVSALGEHGWQLGGPCPSAQLGQVVRGDEQRGGSRRQPWSHISQ